MDKPESGDALECMDMIMDKPESWDDFTNIYDASQNGYYLVNPL